MTFDEILLALIARRARSGYDLKKWLDIEGIFIRANADQSQIYRTLRRLEKHGLIEHDIVRKGGPDAKIYRLTAAGADHLRALADAPYAPPARWQEADFIARVLLLGPISPPSILSMIETELAFRKEQVGKYRGRERAEVIDSAPIPFDTDLIQELSAELDEYGRNSMDDWLVWLTRNRNLWARRLDHASTEDPEPESSSSSDAN